MSNIIALIVLIPFAILVAGALFTYLLVVLPTLRKFNQDHSPKFFASNQYKQMGQYKKICIENKLPMIYSQFLDIFKVTTPILFVIFMIIVIMSHWGLIK